MIRLRLTQSVVLSRLLMLLIVTTSFSRPILARAMFVRYQIEQVPIHRVFTNLQLRLAQDTNNFELAYDLARLHSMAYATKLVSLGVRTNDGGLQFYSPGDDSGVPKSVSLPQVPAERVAALQHLTNAIQLYRRAILLLKTSTNVTLHREWLVLPLELGYAWCLDQAGSRKDALASYRKALALAWKKEVIGEFSFKQWVEDKWNAVKSGNNPLQDTQLRGYIGPGVCYSEEIIGYMLKLLDPDKDKKEIEDLHKRQKSLEGMSRAVTPILVPLVKNAALRALVNPDAAVTFDLDGSGLQRQWGWITTNAAWLVFDPEGRGQITTALQMFGNVTFWIFWHDGYAALSSLDDDGDGVLRGFELRGLALWQDLNGNGVSEPGEVKSAVEWGIVSISCAADAQDPGASWSPKGVTFADGESRPTYDWIAPRAAHAAREAAGKP